MAKSKVSTRKSHTHFEQVPIEIVKKIAEQDAPRNAKAGTARAGVEPTSRKKR
jgi:hypothetical protein